MVIFPLTTGEDRTLWWAERIVPVLAVSVILLLGATSLASTPM